MVCLHDFQSLTLTKHNMIRCQTCELEHFSTIMLKTPPQPDRFGVVFYTITWVTKDIPKHIVKREIRKASNEIQEQISPLKLVYTEEFEKAKIVHQFGWVAPHPFWQDSLAYVPNSWPYKHTIFYRHDEDDFVEWETTHELDVVAEHEYEHTFGIWHNTKEPESIMAPYYARWNYATEFDISQIREKMHTYIINAVDVDVWRNKLSAVIRRNKDQFAKINESVIDKILDLFGIEHELKQTKPFKILLFCNYLDGKSYTETSLT